MTNAPAHSLVPITTSGDRAPLFVVHGAGGGIGFVEEFARLLEGVRPVVAFRAYGLDGSATPDPDVAAMVERYVAELREFHPGPYVLAGYSSGGTIALEMVEPLRRLGHDVTRVILFDCWPRGDATQPRWLRRLRLLRYLVTDGYRPVRPYLGYVSRGRIGGDADHDPPPEEWLELDDVDEFFRRTLRILADHEFGRYDVDAVLIKSELNWPSLPRDYGWSRLLARPLDIRIARGHHITMWWPQFAPHLVALVEELLGDDERR